MRYSWQSVQLDDHRFLSPLKDLFESAEIQNFTATPDIELSRADCDGFITVRGKIGGRFAGVIYNDFRVGGGSFGKETSKRITAFLETMGENGYPVVFLLNTLGVRIMEGRTVFTDAFQLLPAALKFSRSNLFVTCTMGRCLGLGALLFGMGHYRFAVRDESLLNLAGPEVLNLFFGTQVNFDEIASVERHFEKTDLVHELLPSRETALRKIRHLLSYANEGGAGLPREYSSHFGAACEGEYINPELFGNSDARLQSLLARVGDHPVEVYEQLSPIVRTFLVKRGATRIGVFINPPGHPNNMINVAALQKYSAAIDFFRALQVPVISFLDTPGADPRAEQGDRNIISALIQVTQKVIEYPYGSMGVLVGRAYGGATVLGFPKIFGGLRSIALKGSIMGIMDENIITHLLSGSPRLLEEWKKTSAAQTPDLKDLLDAGILDAHIAEDALEPEIDEFLIAAMEKLSRDVEERISRRAQAARRPLVPRLRLIPGESFGLPVSIPANSDIGARFPH